MQACLTTILLAVLAASGAHGQSQAPGRPQTLGADWPMFRGDAAQTGVAAGTLGETFELSWRFETEGAIVSSPVVADGVVYFGSDDGKLYAVDLALGEKKWAFATEDIIEAPAMVHGGIVYVGSSDFFFYAVDVNTGKLLWKFETEDRVLGGAAWFAGPPEEADRAGRVVVGSYDAKLYCFNAKSGEKLWEYQTDNYVNGTPALLDDRIVFGGCDSVLHMISAERGVALGKLPLCPECHIAGSVGLKDGRAYFGHYGNAFTCVDMEKAEIVWEYPGRSAFFSSPAIGTDRVVFGGRDKFVHCARLSDGEPLWKFKTRRKVDGSPVLCGDKVVIGSGDGWIHVLKLADGESVWSYELGDSIFSSAAVVAGRILVGCNDHAMYAFGPPSEEDDS